MNKNEARLIIGEDWKKSSEFHVCLSILDYLCALPDSSRCLTYNSFKNIINPVYDDKHILSAIQYLCGNRVHLLDSGFELIEGDYACPLEYSDIDSFEETGVLMHPETGQEVIDGKKKIFVHFSPTQLVKEIRESQE